MVVKITDNEVYEDFDCKIGTEADDDRFTLLPAGTYPYRITKFDRVRFEGSEKIPACWKAELTLEINGGEAGTAYVRENIFLTKKQAWRIKQLFVSVGQISKYVEEFVPNWNALVGDGGMLQLSRRTFKGRNGDDINTNDVKKFLDPKEAAKAVSTTQGTQRAFAYAQTGFKFPQGA